MAGIGAGTGAEIGIGIQVSQWAIQMAIVIAWLGFVGAMAVGVKALPYREPELLRKVVHIGTGNVILLAWWLQVPTSIGMLASLLFSGLTLLSHVRPVLPGINAVGRRSLGTFFYALSIGLLIAWFWPRQLPQLAVLGVLVMTWGDGLAGLIGKIWGRHRYHLLGMEKSWEGSATMMVVSFGISLAVFLATAEAPGWLLGLGAIAIATVSTALEAVSWFGIDNLTVPLGSAFLAWAWLSWLHGMAHF